MSEQTSTFKIPAHRALSLQLDYLSTFNLPSVLSDLISEYIYKPLPFIEELKQLRQRWLHRILMHDIHHIYYNPLLHRFLDETYYYAYEDSIRIGPDSERYTLVSPPSLIPSEGDQELHDVILKYPTEGFCTLNSFRYRYVLLEPHLNFCIGVLLHRLASFLQKSTCPTDRHRYIQPRFLD